jgi:hypothetical protein
VCLLAPLPIRVLVSMSLPVISCIGVSLHFLTTPPASHRYLQHIKKRQLNNKRPIMFPHIPQHIATSVGDSPQHVCPLQRTRLFPPNLALRTALGEGDRVVGALPGKLVVKGLPAGVQQHNHNLIASSLQQL